MSRSTISAAVFVLILAVIAVLNSPAVVDRANDVIRSAVTELDRKFGSGEATVASGDAAGNDTDETARQEDAATASPSDLQHGGASPQQAAEGSEPIAPLREPSFHVLRIEPDGSAVIAGQAGANANVEILSGSDTLASTRAAASGDFVAILDTPLRPGDYELVLRSTEESGESAMSSETAVVSVPEKGREDEVLALVEKPGAPSRFITLPKPDGGDEGEMSQQAAAAGGDSDRASGSSDGNERVSGELAATASGGGQDSGEEMDRERQVALLPSDGQASDASGDTNAEGGLVSDPQAQPGEVASLEDDQSAAVDSPASQEGQSEEDTGSAAGTREPQRETGTPAGAEVPVRIEAVEIDGETVFVAGAAKPGASIRVYANEFLLGDAVVSPAGRFLVQVNRDLPPGDYIIRADVINPATAEVMARAAVPFRRNEGGRQAAIAMAEGGSESGNGAAAQAATGRSEAKPGDEQMASAAPKAATSGDSGNQTSSEPAVVGNATGSRDSIDGQEEQAAKSVPAPQAGTQQSRTASSSELPRQAEEVASLQDPDVETGAPLASPNLAGPPELSPDVPVTMGTLRNSDSAVIIRRGDTLWHISRRVYGRGIRYTTIYFANQQQIRDPDMIWPGQIFSLPGEALPEPNMANVPG